MILAAGRIVAEGTPPELTRRLASTSEVRYSRAALQYVHATEDATRFVRELFAQYGDEIGDLEVRRSSLEDVYLTLVRNLESGRSIEAAPELMEARA